MKKIFIEAKYKGSIDTSKIKADKLPNKVGLISSVQFVDFLDEVKDYLEKNGKKACIEEGYQKYAGQVLGCEQSSAVKLRAMVDAYLYIGDGRFHPIGAALKTGKDVYIFNPLNNEFRKLEKREIEKTKMRRKAQLLKFYSSKEIGVIISTKPGQNKLDEARKLKEEYPDKNFYMILFDNIDYSQLENFNFVECWINTACPRIEEDIRVLNIGEMNLSRN